MNKNANVNADDAKNPILESGYDELCDLISKTQDSEFLKEFFGCLFTPSERKDIAERWLLVKELNSGTTQREIAKKYNMSLCKITRGSKELRKVNSAFGKMLSFAGIPLNPVISKKSHE